MNRRKMLGLLAAAAAGAVVRPDEALAIGESSRVGIGQLKYSGGNWRPRDGATRKMLLEVEKRTSILVDPVVKGVDAESEELFEEPFLIWSGDQGFDELSEKAVTNLGLFMRAGGFLLISSAEGVEDGTFDASIRREMARILPDMDFEPVSTEHVIYKSFYLLDQPYGRLELETTLQGIPQDDRLMAIYTQNDVEGAWARDNFGNYLYDVTPGGERQRDLSFRFGINCMMYALCINYKADQVHVPFILQNRNWKVD